MPNLGLDWPVMIDRDATGASVDWAWRETLAEALRPATARLVEPEEHGRPAPGAGTVAKVEVGWFDYARRRACVGAQGEPFAWSARFARRTLGLAALGELPAVGYRSDRALARAREAASDSGLGEWLATLPPGGVEATLAEAATWLAAAVAVVGPGQVAELAWEQPGARIDWRAPRSPLVLSARAEGATSDHRRATNLGLIRLVDHTATTADERSEAGWLAVLHAVRFGVAPNRVIVADLRRRRRRTHRVDDALLTEGVAVLSAASADAVAAKLGDHDRADTVLTPGRHCRWCARRGVCPVGPAE